MKWRSGVQIRCQVKLKTHFNSVQSLSCVWLSVTPLTAACHASLSIINTQNLLKLMSIQLVMPTDHLILCHPLCLLRSIFPSIRVSSHESVLCIRWPKYQSFSFSISPSSEYSVFISFRIDWFDLLADSFQASSPAPQFKSINSSVLNLLYGTACASVHDRWKKP